jgi:tetratricopeptide (TPR) repeat protein
MSTRLTVILLLSGAILLATGLVLAPRLPFDKRAAAKANPVDLRLSEAVNLVQNSENPMQGIQMLRAILDEDSTNVDAHWHLAQFSITSRQIENAEFRFEKVLQFDVNQKYPEAYFWLAQTKISLDQPREAIPLLEKYLTLEKDTIILAGVERMVDQLRADLN